MVRYIFNADTAKRYQAYDKNNGNIIAENDKEFIFRLCSGLCDDELISLYMEHQDRVPTKFSSELSSFIKDNYAMVTGNKEEFEISNPYTKTIPAYSEAIQAGYDAFFECYMDKDALSIVRLKSWLKMNRVAIDKVKYVYFAPFVKTKEEYVRLLTVSQARGMENIIIHNPYKFGTDDVQHRQAKMLLNVLELGSITNIGGADMSFMKVFTYLTSFDISRTCRVKVIVDSRMDTFENIMLKATGVEVETI